MAEKTPAEQAADLVRRLRTSRRKDCIVGRSAHRELIEAMAETEGATSSLIEYALRHELQDPIGRASIDRHRKRQCCCWESD